MNCVLCKVIVLGSIILRYSLFCIQRSNCPYRGFNLLFGRCRILHSKSSTLLASPQGEFELEAVRESTKSGTPLQ